MSKRAKGKLMIIGGRERSEKGKTILETIANEADGGSLVLVTAATYEPEGVHEEYSEIFGDLGLRKIEVVDIRTREDAHADENVRKLAKASVIFFTGGDQLRITSQIGDSPVYRCLRDKYIEGCTVAGTSAGAAAMPQTMIVDGAGDESSRISALSMAPGLGLLPNVIVDSHFAERGRIGRLLGAVAENPRNLGLGIDESTAILVERDKHFRVLGEGAVYVVDGINLSYSSLSEDTPEGIITIHNVTLHVLGEGDCYSLEEQYPILPKERQKVMA